MKKTMKVRVHIQNLMLQAAQAMQAPGYVMGFQIAEQCLLRIAERAVEIGDETILEELDTLMLVKKDD